MRRFLVVLVALFLSISPAQADVLKDIEQIISSVESKYSLRLEYKYVPSSADTTAQYQEATYNDYRKLLRFLQLFETEVNKYPVDFFRNSNLEAVYFVKKFFYSKHPSEGLYSPSYRVIFLDFARRYNKERMARNIHHEIYHLIEHQSRLSKNEKVRWADFNDKGFKYGQSFSPSVFSKNKPPYQGFVTSYGLSKPEEDRAETFAGLMIPAQSRLIHRWIDNDDILRNKVEYIKSLSKQFCEGMSNQFWTQLQR